METQTKENKGFRYGLGVFIAPSRVPALPEAIPNGITSYDLPQHAQEIVGENPATRLLPDVIGDAYDTARLKGTKTVIAVDAGALLDAPIVIRPGSLAETTLIFNERSRGQVLWESSNVPFRSDALNIVAMPGSSVDVVCIGSGSTAAFSRRRVAIGTRAAVRWTDVRAGGEFLRERLHVALIGEGASVDHRTAGISAGAAQHDLATEFLHLAPRTASATQERAVLAGQAKTIVRSGIRIGTEPGCDGRERIEALLLSPDAECDAIPTLEIGTGNVSCGHAGAIGPIDPERLFYLTSRGLDEPSAKRAIALGHLDVSLANLDAATRERAQTALSALIN
jgi:Fe-S cluster assembly scaffold protein SufB